jgi:hypothetical protein
MADTKTEPQLAHDVYFTLHDASPEARGTLLDACRKYLTGHPGVVAFACGPRAEGLDRPVNDRGFDVSLHIVFENRAAHDAYQDAPRHHQFVAECRGNWKQVRVFDSLVDLTVTV